MSEDVISEVTRMSVKRFEEVCQYKHKITKWGEMCHFLSYIWELENGIQIFNVLWEFDTHEDAKLFLKNREEYISEKYLCYRAL